MKRLIMEQLVKWKKSPYRKPLILKGVRQVGKTWILKEFGRQYYESTAYFNFDENEEYRQFFETTKDVKRILQNLILASGQKIMPEKTLIIFDEIQACERALTSLKYFCEEAPEYHIAAAGSLLGVAINREKYSFPVGKVIMKTLYPLRFDEFLRAVGKAYFIDLILEHFAGMAAMPADIHQEILEWYYRYLYIGGMPAAINEYLNRESLVNVPEVQGLILNSYTADMAKYTTDSESTRIKNAYGSMPAQLAKENKKFQYKLIRKGATAGIFGDSIAWLVFSGVVLRCDRVSRGNVPLIAFRDVSAFKLYLSDVGLLSAFSGITPEGIIRHELSELYRGSLTENYVAQTLVSGGYELYYWTSDSPPAEVDFVIQKKGCVVPIEVKSGENVRSKSLKHFSNMYMPEKIIRLSEKNFGTEGNIDAVPLYAAFCI